MRSGSVQHNETNCAFCLKATQTNQCPDCGKTKTALIIKCWDCAGTAKQAERGK